MPSANYTIAHQLIPMQAAKRPAEMWTALSGPDWSMWLAMVGQTLGMPVRGIGVEGVVTGNAIITRAGYELLAVYFPEPAGPGEPYYAIIARKAGENALRTFVFEKGISDPGAPLRVVMAEWRYQDGNPMRIRFDAAEDPKLEACLARTIAVLAPSSSPEAPAVPSPAPSPTQPVAPPTPGRSNVAFIAVGIALVLAVLIWVLTH